MVYEIKKLLSVRGIVLWIVFLTVASLLCPLYYTYRFRRLEREYYNKDIDAAYQRVWSIYQGGGSEDSVADEAHEEYTKTAEISNLSFERPLYSYLSYIRKRNARSTGKIKDYGYNMEKHSMLGINAQLNKIENTDSYQYKNLLREKAMMEKCESEYANVNFWNKFDVWETCIVFVIYLFVLFSLSGTYTKERASNMNYILCTAKIGFLKIISNKWLAGCIIGMGSILAVNINLTVAFILCGNSSGYDANIVSLGAELVYTPYNITILEYMLLKILFQIIGIMFLVAFVQYMSLLNMYRYPAILYGGLLFIPQMVSYYAIGRDYIKIFDIIYDLSLLSGINTLHAFYKYHAFNIFGNPVDYNTLYIIILVVLTAAIGILTVKKYHRYIYRFNGC